MSMKLQLQPQSPTRNLLFRVGGYLQSELSFCQHASQHKTVPIAERISSTFPALLGYVPGKSPEPNSLSKSSTLLLVSII